MDHVNKPVDDEDTESELSEEEELLWQQRSKRVLGASVFNNGIDVAGKEILEKNNPDPIGKLTVRERIQFDPESAHLDDLPLSQVQTVLQVSHLHQCSPEGRAKDILEASKPISTLPSSLPPHNVSPVELESTDLAAKAPVPSNGGQKSREEPKGTVFFHNKPNNGTKACFTENQFSSLQDENDSNELGRSKEGDAQLPLQDFKGTSSTDASDSPMTDRNKSMEGEPKDASDDSDEEPAVAKCSEGPKTTNEPTPESESDFRSFEGGNTDRDDHLAEHRTDEYAQNGNVGDGNHCFYPRHRSSSTHTSESPDPDAEEGAQAIDPNILQEGELSDDSTTHDGSIQPQKAFGKHPGECSDDSPEVAELSDAGDGTASKLSSQSSAPKTSPAVANASTPANNGQQRPHRGSRQERDADLNRRKTKDGCLIPKTAPKKREDGTFARPCGRIPRGMVWDEVRGLYVPKSKSNVSEKTIETNKETEETCSESDESADEQEEEDSLVSEHLTDEEENGNARKPRKWREADLHNRMAEDGSFLPHPTYQAVLKRGDDGLYLRPPGRCPTGTVWDPHRGRYVREEEELSITGKRDKVSNVSSSLDGDRANKRQKKNADKNIACRAAAAPESCPSSSNGTLSFAQLAKKRRQFCKIGTRVYAEWPKPPKGWHFATIMDIKRKPNSHYDQYSLLFDDGDFLEFTSLSSFVLDEEYRAVGYAEPFPPMPRAHAKRLEKILKPASAIGTAMERMNVDNRSTLTLEELLQQACGECRHCQKPDCGQCASCLTNQTQVCIQKMCCKIPIESKAQPMPPSSKFPEGWKFVIDPSMPSYDGQKAKIAIRLGVRGLKLYPPIGKLSYYSVEAAKNSNNTRALADVSPEGFYQHIGALCSGPPRCETASQLSLPQAALSIHRVKGSRVYCSDNEMWGIIEKKLQLVNGLFRYSVRLEDDNTFLHGLGDEGLLTEEGYVCKTGSKAPPPSELASVEHNIDTNSYKLDGTEIITTTATENFLVGRKLCFAWLDANGQQKEVRGSVVACELDMETDDVISCLVTYNQKSRALANSTTRGSLVPEYHWLEPALVVGACMLYEEQFSRSSERLSELTNAPVHSTWINPDLRHEITVNGLPVLKLAYKGYLLEFRVGESSMEDAGKGVFLSCTSLEEEKTGDFQLDAGVFLDLGVYGGGYRPDGRKTEAAFLVKNFMHSSKCEDFAFDPREHGYQLDITDDITGDLHVLAQNSVLPYVNEGDENQEACIHAMHDPENMVHYLLGNSFESRRKFVLPCDGRETEVFTYYGKGYEKVRVKRGYSSLPEGNERNAFEEELENDDFTDIETMSSFCGKEVENAVNFMFNLFAVGEESQFSDPVMIERALTCAVVLQHRAKHLFLEEEDDDVDLPLDSPVNLLQNLQTSRAVVVSILKLIKGDSHRELQRLQAAGDAKALWKAILDRQQFSDKQLETLERQIAEV